MAYLYFINYYINIVNYEKPNKPFLFFSEGILYKNEYTINHLNFVPAQIKTNNGLIFDNIEEESVHIFERNDVFTKEKNGYDIFISFIFWIKNTMNIHERNYKRIQDIISSIGGIYQFITIVAFI